MLKKYIVPTISLFKWTILLRNCLHLLLQCSPFSLANCIQGSIYFLFPDLLPVLNGHKAEINTEDFLQEIFDILIDYIKKSNDRSNKILDFHHPEQILESMDFSLPEKPQPLDQIFVDCKDALKYQVKTGVLCYFKCIQKYSKTIIFAYNCKQMYSTIANIVYDLKAPQFI